MSLFQNVGVGNYENVEKWIERSCMITYQYIQAFEFSTLLIKRAPIIHNAQKLSTKEILKICLCTYQIHQKLVMWTSSLVT